MSVRNYTTLFLGGRRSSSGGASFNGGNTIAAAGKHALDGPEHTSPADTTRLDVSIEAHGLAPKLPGDPAVFLNGAGAYSAPPSAAAGGMVPYYIEAGDTFVVPEFKQALFRHTITGPGLLVVDGVLVEV